MSARDVGPPTILFIAIMGGATALAIASDITAPMCRAADLRNLAPDKVYFGCLEFWIQRYKEVLSAIIAAGVAFAVVRPVYAQLQEMKKQSALAALPMLQTLIAQAEAETGYLDAILEVRNTVHSLMTEIESAPDTDCARLASEIDAQRHNLESYLQAMDEMLSRRNDSLQEQNDRERFVGDAKGAFHLFSSYSYIWRQFPIANMAYAIASQAPAAQAGCKTGLETLRELTQEYRRTVRDARQRRIERTEKLLQVAGDTL